MAESQKKRISDLPEGNLEQDKEEAWVPASIGTDATYKYNLDEIIKKSSEDIAGRWLPNETDDPNSTGVGVESSVQVKNNGHVEVSRNGYVNVSSNGDLKVHDEGYIDVHNKGNIDVYYDGNIEVHNAAEIKVHDSSEIKVHDGSEIDMKMSASLEIKYAMIKHLLVFESNTEFSELPELPGHTGYFVSILNGRLSGSILSVQICEPESIYIMKIERESQEDKWSAPNGWKRLALSSELYDLEQYLKRLIQEGGGAANLLPGHIQYPSPSGKNNGEIYRDSSNNISNTPGNDTSVNNGPDLDMGQLYIDASGRLGVVTVSGQNKTIKTLAVPASNTVTLVPGKTLGRIHIGQSGTNTDSDYYIPSSQTVGGQTGWVIDCYDSTFKVIGKEVLIVDSNTSSPSPNIIILNNIPAGTYQFLYFFNDPSATPQLNYMQVYLRGTSGNALASASFGSNDNLRLLLQGNTFRYLQQSNGGAGTWTN